ncbi:MAG TPA: GvpL/GvpF family gas vesicle protein [Planctomycetota bacterium]|nr:GvpL/GvpF family gas vesicle protein [Planctomycetota bacterium]
MAKAKPQPKTRRNGAERSATKTKKPAARPGRAAKAAAPAGSRRLAAIDDGDAVLEHLGAEARQSDGQAGNRGKYVYCIIRSSEFLRFGPIGLGSEPSDVHTINHRDLAAVVSDTPMGIQDATRENVLAHQKVNETVMREHTVIPLAFGTVFRTRDDIVALLKSAYDAFSDVLTKMQNKLEFGLKVLWDRDQMIKDIESEDEDVRRLKNEISSQKGSTYFARMQYGRLVDAALQSRSERYVADIFTALRDVCVASRSNKPIGDKMILNAAFLVSRDKESAFDARVKEIGARYDKLTFNYTGPWPPYNFVNIRLKLERAR